MLLFLFKMSDKRTIKVVVTLLLAIQLQSGRTAVVELRTTTISRRTCDKTLEQCQSEFDTDQCYEYTDNAQNKRLIRDCATVCRKDLHTYSKFECISPDNCKGFVSTNISCKDRTSSPVVTTYPADVSTDKLKTDVTFSGTSISSAATSNNSVDYKTWAITVTVLFPALIALLLVKICIDCKGYIHKSRPATISLFRIGSRLTMSL
ncbi:uncharacterized protein [Watersipora subatra]|uniref:uncharacterized protein isoform X2 n=1 Tax=Watersipora subatra TaxID=2589382 RepID=UPI00355BEC19